jgi:hypothetical protein
MPLRSKPIGVPLDVVEYRFGVIRVVFRPHKWVDYWDHWVMYRGKPVDRAMYGLYGPGGLSEEVAREIVEYTLRHCPVPEIIEYWKGGEACP